MMPAKLHQVGEAGLAALAPMSDMVAVDVVLVRTTGETATLVPCFECSAHGRWDNPRFAANIERVTGLVFAQHADAGVTTQAARCFRGNTRPVFQM